MRFEGTLHSWNDDRGFGFIEPAQGGGPIFVHIKAYPPSTGRPQLNQAISFEVETGPKGKRARNAQFAQIRSDRFLQTRRRAAPSYRRVQAQWGGATLFVLPAFLVLYLCVAILWRPPLWVGALYLGASLLTFVVYAMDKAAAIANRWRTRESTMHWLALVGGWPGALLAQQLLRHKSTKPEFRSAFWGTVVMNVAGFLLFCSPLGRQVRALLQ